MVFLKQYVLVPAVVALLLSMSFAHDDHLRANRGLKKGSSKTGISDPSPKAPKSPKISNGKGSTKGPKSTKGGL